MYQSPINFQTQTSLSISSVDGNNQYGYHNEIYYNSIQYSCAPGRNISGGHWGNSGSLLNPKYNGSRALLPVPSLATSMAVVILNGQQMSMTFATRGCKKSVQSSSIILGLGLGKQSMDSLTMYCTGPEKVVPFFIVMDQVLILLVYLMQINV